MTDIIIDETQTGFLIKKLKDLFTPLVISEDIENELVFDNELGKGKFKILTLGRDILNIHFFGEFKDDLKFRFLNSKLPVLNFIYLNKGQLRVEHNDSDVDLKEGETQQFIYNSEIKEFEIITWPAHTKIEFNFIKLFDFSYLNSGNLERKLYSDSSKNNISLKVSAPKSKEIDSKKELISSDLVGKSRMEDLAKKVDDLLQIQLREVF